MNFYKKRKFWKRALWVTFLVPVVLFAIISTIVVFKKDAIIQELIDTANEDFKGEIVIEKTSISPFENFPYISIDLKGFKVFETKNKIKPPIIDLQDVYIGFDFWTVANGKFDIKTIKLKQGSLDIIQDLDGNFNIVKAFEPQKEIDDVSEEFHLDLQKIQLVNVDFNKINLADSIKIDAFFTKAETRFKTTDRFIEMGLDSDFIFNIIHKNDTTFVKNKHFDVHTTFKFDKENHLIDFSPSEIVFENGLFGMEGTIDFDDDFNMDLKFFGKKPNFDLLIAFVPEELKETLRAYENQGEIYFDAVVKGKSAHGNNPLVEAKFGCKDGYFDNTENRQKLDNMFFNAFYTNGSERNLTTSEFQLLNFSAKPEAGIFKGNLVVKNFESPDINLQLNSDFDLEFLTKFFNLKDLSNLTGKVALTMNFHDIIDLQNPEKSLEQFNQAYDSELLITNLNFKSDSYHLPIKNLNLKARMDGNDILMDYFNMKIGSSDIAMEGNIRNIPAVIHKTNDEIRAKLNISSKLMDFKELTTTDNVEGIDEQISNFRVGLRFKGAANTLITSKSLPEGNFFIEDFYGKLKNYPHTFHDFDAKIFIRENEVKVVNFDGMIDDSDFHLTGKIDNYNLWMADVKRGDTHFEFDFNSKLLRLEDLFAYKGENYIPEDYRHEEIRELRAHGRVALHFQDSLQSTDTYIDLLKGKMKIHPMKFENFKGNLHFENERLTLNQVSGKIGKSDFTVSGKYYLGTDKKKKNQGDKILLTSNKLDFDELFSYQEPKSTPQTSDSSYHDSGFNVFEIPFRDMQIEAQIKDLNYHKYIIKNFRTKLRVKQNHFVYVDQMLLDAASGKVDIKGYFNGSNPKQIYFNPDIKVQKVNLDQVLFKFDNFGQDMLVSDNLHGILTGRITGKILMHKDLTPRIDESDLQIDFSVLEGRLDNFGPMNAMADFFKDKNLTKIRFDKLENRLKLKNGRLEIPNMLINSSLGFMELSGSQDMNLNMEYYMRIPLKMVTSIASQKLFGKKREEVDTEQEDDIIYKDPNRKVSFVNVKITGTPSDYKISLQKNKDLKKGVSFKKDDTFLFDSIGQDSLADDETNLESPQENNN
jgi:hypothetical protein